MVVAGLAAPWLAPWLAAWSPWLWSPAAGCAGPSTPYHLGWSSTGDAPGHRAGSPFLTLVVDEHHQGELTFLFPSFYGANLSTRTLTSYLVICVQI